MTQRAHLQQLAQVGGEGGAQRLLARHQRQAARQAPHHRVRRLRIMSAHISLVGVDAPERRNGAQRHFDLISN